MNDLTEFWNGTVSTNYIKLIMPLISLMSTHFLVNSFTLITDGDTATTFPFAKIASSFYLKFTCKESFAKKDLTDTEDYENIGYIVMGKPDFSFESILKYRPKLVVAIHTVKGGDPRPPKIFSEVTIPPLTSFFVILLPEYFSSNNTEATIKCLRLYKPTSTYTLKVFPTMFYGGVENPQWTWERENMNWNSYQLEVRKMNGITVNISLFSHLERKVAVDKYWNGSQSFFWKAMEEHYQLQFKILFGKVSSEGEKGRLPIFYGQMLVKKAQGIAALPVMTKERIYFMSFIVTGIDLKHHLLVRTPQYLPNWKSIFKPFAIESWVCLAAVILLISITLKITLCWEISPTADLTGCCLTVYGFVCAQACPHMPKNLSGCITCFTALLMSVLIYQFYTSNFYSLLRTKEVRLPFTSLEDFMAKKTHALYIMPESALFRSLKTAQGGTLKEVWDLVGENPSHHLTDNNKKKLLENFCRGNAAIFALPTQLMTTKNMTCDVVSVNSGYLSAPIVTALTKNYPFKSQFQFLHMRFLEAGITHKFRDQHFKLKHEVKPTQHQDMNNEAVPFVHVAFLLVLLVVTSTLSCVILFIEILVSKFTKSKKPNISEK